MVLYVININEKSEKGKEHKSLLRKKQPAMKLFSLVEYEKQEELALMKVMGKPVKESLISSTHIRKALAKIKRQLSK